MSDLQTLFIGDFSVTFYGGPEGFQNECRVIVTLYDKSGVTSGFIKFYNEGAKIKNDGFDDNKLFNLNLPDSAYFKVIDTLRSKRLKQLLFDGKIGMLVENKNPSAGKKGINLN